MRPVRPHHDRDPAGRPVLLRRALPPAVPGQGAERLLRARGHGRRLSDRSGSRRIDSGGRRRWLTRGAASRPPAGQGRPPRRQEPDNSAIRRATLRSVSAGNADAARAGARSLHERRRPTVGSGGHGAGSHDGTSPLGTGTGSPVRRQLRRTGTAIRRRRPSVRPCGYAAWGRASPPRPAPRRTGPLLRPRPSVRPCAYAAWGRASPPRPAPRRTGSLLRPRPSVRPCAYAAWGRASPPRPAPRRTGRCCGLGLRCGLAGTPLGGGRRLGGRRLAGRGLLAEQLGAALSAADPARARGRCRLVGRRDGAVGGDQRPRSLLPAPQRRRPGPRRGRVRPARCAGDGDVRSPRPRWAPPLRRARRLRAPRRASRHSPRPSPDRRCGAGAGVWPWCPQAPWSRRLSALRSLASTSSGTSSPSSGPRRIMSS